MNISKLKKKDWKHVIFESKMARNECNGNLKTYTESIVHIYV